MMVGDNNRDPMSKLYAEWVSASVRLSVAGFDAAAKIMEAGMQSVTAARARSNASAKPAEAPRQGAPAQKAEPVTPKVVPAAPKLVVSKAAPKPVAKESGHVAPKLSAKADDLKLISGIGPKLEQMLQKRGITGFAQIAAWKAAEIAKLDEDMGLNGRIQRDDWVGQAAKLAG